VNDEVVRRAAWDSTVLADGDQIEILTAVQGG
jgi:sulfur carrier protein